MVSIIVVDADELMLYSSFRSPAERQRRYFAVADLFDKFFGAPLEVQVLGNRKWISGKFLVAERFGVGWVMRCTGSRRLFRDRAYAERATKGFRRSRGRCEPVERRPAETMNLFMVHGLGQVPAS